MSVYHDDRLQNRLQKLFALLQAKRIHESDFSIVTRLQAMSSYSFSLMTVNMNGKTKNQGERRDLLSEIITSTKSSLIFCQELPDCFEKDVVRKCKGTCDYDYVFSKKLKHAAVMWSKQDFHDEPVEYELKKEIGDKLVKLKEIDDKIENEILLRTAIVKLTAKGEEACNFPKPPFLAVSWHGPHSGKNSWTLEKKQKALRGLILFLCKVCRKIKDVSLIIIGGDFNLNTSDEKVVNVKFQKYKLSPRAKQATERKGKGRPYIAYKDNFAITTISPSVGRPFDMKLSKVKPLSNSKFNFVKEEGRERGKDILDHDPIIGVLQLGKTPSAGTFWLS